MLNDVFIGGKKQEADKIFGKILTLQTKRIKKGKEREKLSTFM